MPTRMVTLSLAAVALGVGCVVFAGMEGGPDTEPVTEGMLRGSGKLLLKTMATAAADKVVVAWITAPPEAAQKLAGGLVEEELAACVNIMPEVKSVYKWKGKIETDTEALLMVKTRKANIEHIAAYLKANHPYDCPELISADIDGGLPQYLQWVLDNTKTP
ncbi:Protein CutA [Diplonema papillatum]|nr:Protein CutA [Diplonema papillatum]